MAEVELEPGWLLRDTASAAFKVALKEWVEAQWKANHAYNDWQKAVADYDRATERMQEARKAALAAKASEPQNFS